VLIEIQKADEINDSLIHSLHHMLFNKA